MTKAARVAMVQNSSWDSLLSPIFQNERNLDRVIYVRRLVCQEKQAICSARALFIRKSGGVNCATIVSVGKKCALAVSGCGTLVESNCKARWYTEMPIGGVLHNSQGMHMSILFEVPYIPYPRHMQRKRSSTKPQTVLCRVSDGANMEGH